MPVNWQDGVTWVNAANLEIMEADTAAKQAQSEKAQANGYAPLDGTAKVPLVHLPPVSGVDYIGTWGSGIAYKRGDVVRYSGNDYLAVNDSTGVTPPAAYAPPLGGVSIGTSLPAAPFDGQEFVLTDSLTAPNYQWRFRYTASVTDAYKWVFIGGAPMKGTEVAELTVAAGTWQPNNPTLTLPRAGTYLFNIHAAFNGTATSPGHTALLSVTLAPVGAVGTTGPGSACLAAYGATAHLVHEALVAAGATAKVAVYRTDAGASSYRQMEITPVRVS